MKILCPNCNSPNVSSPNTRRCAGILIGIVAGAAIGFRLRHLSNSDEFTGLIFGAVSGCKAGLILGKKIDDQITTNYLCHACFLLFNK